MELTKQAYHFVLAWRLVTGLDVGNLPQLPDCPFAVHQPDETVGGGPQTVRAAARMVLQDEPYLPPVIVAMDLHMSAQSRFQLRDAIPGGAEE